MASQGKQVCPQCYFENQQHAEKCALCGWQLDQEVDDATRFVPLSENSPNANLDNDNMTVFVPRRAQTQIQTQTQPQTHTAQTPHTHPNNAEASADNSVESSSDSNAENSGENNAKNNHPVTDHSQQETLFNPQATPYQDSPPASQATDGPETFTLKGELAHLEVNQIIGRGGMGTVYRATDHTLERQVAIKALRAHKGLDDLGRDLLLEEARTICKLNHPNIVTVFDVAQGDDNHFIIMEWIEGATLNKLIPADGFGLATALGYAQQIVQGLVSAHQNQVIHSDIKPQNIMLTDNGDIKILDFGIARLAQQQADKNKIETPVSTYQPANVNGTSGYMSPEQALGINELDQRSDVFAFGIVFYQLLVGHSPFSGKNPKQKNAAIITGDYPPLPASIPMDVRAMVDHCLQQSPQQRYQSSTALAADIQAYQDGEPVAVVNSKRYWLKKKTLKHKWPVLLLMLVMAGGLGQGLYQQLKATQQAYREQLLTRFISRVETLEANVQMSKMAPVHDTTAETVLWHQQIDALQAESEALGQQAIGAAGYAIGRMYYALQDYDQALAYLQQAWQNGLTQPRVAYNLALTHGAIYQRQQALIANLNSRSARKDRTAKLDAEHKQPAIDYLNQGLQGSPYYSYTQALLHYYQGDYDNALHTLKNAQDLPTWFYDHHTLKGDIYLAKAEAQGGAHGDETVEQYAQQAIQSYAQAAELGRSDLQLQLKPLNVYFRLLNNDLYGKGEQFLALYEQTLSYLNTAQTLAPQDYRPYLVKGQVLWLLTRYEDQYSGQPLETVDQAVTQLVKANDLLPSNPDILFMLAIAKRQALYLKLNQQQPVDDDIAGATALFEQIPDVHRDYYYFNSFGLLMSDLSNHYQQQSTLLLLNGYSQKVSAEQAKRTQAQALFTKADAAFVNATRLQPERIGALINRGSLYRLWAAYQEPEQAKAYLTQAIAIYKQAKELNPEHFVVNYYLAVSHHLLARVKNQLHQPNLGELNQVKNYYERANQAQPNHPFLQGLDAFYQTDQAIYSWQRAADYVARLDKSIEQLKAQVSSYPANQRFIDGLAYLQIIKGQINTFENKQDLHFLKNAIAHSKLANQARGNPQSILLQLLIGNWQNIAQTEIEQLKFKGVEVLARAEWYSQSGQFAQAEYYFDQVTQYYPSLLWLYRHQHLHRWLKALQTQSDGDPKSNNSSSNNNNNSISNNPSSLNKVQQIATLQTAITQLEQKLQRHYPKLTIPRYP